LNFSIGDLLIAIVWGLGLLLTLAGSLVSAVLCICLSGKPRATAIDCLLWLATLTIVIFNAAAFLPKSLTKGKAADSVQFSYQRKADLLALDIEAGSYLDRLQPPWTNIARFERAWTTEKALQKSKRVLEALFKDHGEDPLIASRLSIVMHESGDPVQKQVIDKFAKRHDDQLMSFLRQLYSYPNKVPLQKLPSIEPIRDRLPEGWYRNAVLKEYYKNTSDPARLDLVKRDEDKAASRWIAKYIALKIAVASFALLGLTCVILFCCTPRVKDLSAPANYGFRKTYGCMLSSLFTACLTSIVSAFFIGLASGLKATMNHTTVEYPNSSAIITPLVVVTGTLSTLLTFYFFICRPAGLSVRKALLEGRQVCGFAMSVVYSLGGFGAAMFFSAINELVCSRLGLESNTNEAVLQMVNAVLTTNVVVFLWSCCWFCILAPFTEELLMRVLLYPWLRHRIGVTAGIIVSSAIFAAIHFNFSYFFHYFAIGAILAAVYERTRNFPVIVGIHGLWNAWTIVAVNSLIQR
jgi:membrane protease YdiL (CAAX protease family)